jgi:hypothetical protein
VISVFVKETKEAMLQYYRTSNALSIMKSGSSRFYHGFEFFFRSHNPKTLETSITVAFKAACGAIRLFVLAAFRTSTASNMQFLPKLGTALHPAYA